MNRAAALMILAGVATAGPALAQLQTGNGLLGLQSGGVQSPIVQSPTMAPVPPPLAPLIAPTPPPVVIPPPTYGSSGVAPLSPVGGTVAPLPHPPVLGVPVTGSSVNKPRDCFTSLLHPAGATSK